ncbi:hypothetical protein P879_02584 [Paragonimus westermani]|uniref:ABC transporter domain-containing protein n=1 Tax=Paragonimus westermani TaxID=34504 RepID=A0A8T0D486_9TREM|nr:hypothetical protein P879_02584 [Paragonimus westermani]
MYKFCIVLGKNYRLFYRAWIQTLIIILLPVALASALVFLRNESTRVQIPSAVHWESFSLNTLPPPPIGYSVWVLAYAPNISLCNEVMQAAAQNLSLDTMAFVSEDELLRFLQLARERRSPNNVLGAVIFDSFDSMANVSYTIRLPNTIEWQTRMLYPKFAEGKPRTFDSYASPPAYHSSGFLSIQSTIDQVIAQLFCGGNFSSMPEIDMKLQRMPFPPYLDDGFIPIIQRQLSLVIVLGFTFPVLHAIRLVLVEKQERVKETLKMLGMSNGIYWCSWLTAYLSLFAILNALLTALLCLNCSKNGPILAASNPLLIYMLLMLYAFSLLTFGFAISTFFDSPHTGTAIGCAILILVFLPYALLDEHYVELNLATKLISSFLPSVGMGFVCMLIGQFEGTGLGVQFSSLASSANPGDNLSLDMLWIVFLIEGKLFMLFTLYVDAVRPGKYGVPKPWHFPFTYFCRKKPTSSLSLSVSAEEIGQSDLAFALSPPEGKQNSVQVAGTSRSSGSYSLCPSEHQSTCALRKPSCSSDNVFEADPVGLAIGISLINVRKVYASKQAVNAAVSGLTMNIFQGQITVLLGHNGAGKTTTLSILTGLYPPTSGTAFVNGHNIQKDIESVRKSLGFCPQEDVYFKNFTVEEHLILVARLKGYGGSELKSEVRKILQQTRLTHKRYAFAGTLSGGMRRRLSIGMALIGDSKVVILDEPTSGLDPEARRHVWTILQAARATRTVLVTTHYMDEADHLGDRIAILAAGKLQCFGSPLFLKAKYGAGYLLTVNKREDVQPEHLLSRVQLFVPGAHIRMHQGEELKLLLPLDSVSQFAALFSDLETNKAELGICSFGTSVTTMEEVFFRVSEQDNGTHRTTASGPSSTCEGDDSVSIRPRTPIDVLSDIEDSLTVQSCYTYSEIREMRNHGFSLYWQQLTALSIKRGIYALRHRLLILSQIVIPLVLSLFALLIFRHLTVLVQADNPSLLVSLTSFVDQASGSGVVVSYANANNETESSVAEQLLWTYSRQFDPLSRINSRRMQQPDSYEDNLINEVGRVNLFQYRGEYIVGLVVDSSPVSNSTYSIGLRGYFQGESFHSAPASLNAVTNALLRLFVNRSSRYPHECPALHPVPKLSPHVSTYNHPLPRTDAERAQRLNTTEGLIVSLVASVPLVSNLLLALSYLAATFSMALIHEYNTRAKHLQFVSGVKLLPYWLSNYIWDILIFFVVSAVILIVFAWLNLDAFATKTRLYLVAILFIAYVWAVLPEMYLLARWFKSPTSGLVWLTVFNDFTAIIGLLVVAILSYPSVHQQELSYSLHYFWVVFSPTFSLAYGLLMVFENYQFRRLCDHPEMEFLCLFQPTMPCCLKTCDPFCAYWTPNDLSFNRGGIGFNLCLLLLQGIVFNSLVLFLDSVAARRFYLYLKSVCSRLCYVYFGCGKCCSQAKHDSLSTLQGDEDADRMVEDEDVRQHRHLVESMPLNRLKEQTTLTLRQVSKTYGSFIDTLRNRVRPAVDRLTVAVLPAECFGFLGVNGAGKTTTFRMLTGDLDPTEGMILVNGFELSKDLRKAQQSMGYCPQFDALLPYLTGRETLQLYGRLRGIREDILNVEVDQLLYDLGLSHYANVRVDTYSGGKRRKLSVAVALVGGTPLVCLDEPTSGVDPVSRRRMWHLLRRCRRQGRTLVLSSHSMEECEALCSRVSIFVNGRLKCLGTCQHLKARFGRGYSLTLQVAAPPHLVGSSSTEESLPLLVTSDSLATSLAEDLSHAQQVAFDQAVNQAMRFVQEQFPIACLVDRHQGVIHYHLPITTSDSFCLGDVFRLMESNKSRLGLVNYSISQTTLEQVFIDLAKLQEEYTTDNQSATSTDLRRPHCLRRTCRLCVDCARCSCCRSLSSPHELEVTETESLFATR